MSTIADIKVTHYDNSYNGYFIRCLLKTVQGTLLDIQNKLMETPLGSYSVL